MTEALEEIKKTFYNKNAHWIEIQKHVCSFLRKFFPLEDFDQEIQSINSNKLSDHIFLIDPIVGDFTKLEENKIFTEVMVKISNRLVNEMIFKLLFDNSKRIGLSYVIFKDRVIDHYENVERFHLEVISPKSNDELDQMFLKEIFQ